MWSTVKGQSGVSCHRWYLASGAPSASDKRTHTAGAGRGGDHVSSPSRARSFTDANAGGRYGGASALGLRLCG
jgi:hypothetical protein